MGQRISKKAVDFGKSQATVTKDRLHDMFATLVSKPEVREQLKQMFQLLRILVIGRSGSGKSTLIQLMVGDGSGPRTISNATAGKHDICREWRSNDPALPDSNGIAVNGSEQLEAIDQFLEKRSSKEEFSEKIDLIWYVISGVDNRFLDDGDTLERVSAYKIPLLLIITHNDHPGLVEQVLTNTAMSKLLSRIADPRFDVELEWRPMSSKSGTANWQELRWITLSEATRQHLDEKLRLTWAAIQAVDMDVKLDASADLIVRLELWSWLWSVLTTPVVIIPFVEPIKIVAMLATIIKSLCTIWRVPKNFERALWRQFATKDVLDIAEKNALTDYEEISAFSMGLVISDWLGLISKRAC